MTRAELIKLTAKGLLVWLLLSGLGWYFEEALGNALLPALSNRILDILYRSAFIGAAFFGMALVLGISEDINGVGIKVLKAVREKLR